MKRPLSILVLLLVAAVPFAVAQMGGNGNRSGQNGTMNGTAMNGMAGHRGFLVGSDGTAYALRVATSRAGAPAAFEVVAVRPSGAIGWTAAVASGIPSIDLSGSDLLVTTRTIGTPSAAASTLTALSTASGAARWTVKLDGIALAVEPFSGGTYVTVMKPSQAGSSGGMQGNHGQATGGGARTLVAVGTDGKILWTLALGN